MNLIVSVDLLNYVLLLFFKFHISRSDIILYITTPKTRDWLLQLLRRMELGRYLPGVFISNERNINYISVRRCAGYLMQMTVVML